MSENIDVCKFSSCDEQLNYAGGLTLIFDENYQSDNNVARVRAMLSSAKLIYDFISEAFNSDELFSKYFAVVMYNAVFVLEIYFKAIIVMEHSVSELDRFKTHNLVVLFEALSLESRESIKALVSDESFDSSLVKIKDAFKKFRYDFEYSVFSGINRDFIKTLIVNLDVFVLSLYESNFGLKFEPILDVVCFGTDGL